MEFEEDFYREDYLPRSGYGANDEERAYYAQLEKESREEVLKDDPISQACKHIYFVSWSNGAGRKLRSRPREVELLEYNGKVYPLDEGNSRIHEIAAELLKDTVHPHYLVETFVERVRGLSASNQIHQ